MSIDVPSAPPIAPTAGRATPPPPDVASVVADLRRAAEVVAPQWPLTSVVAVNPLSGFEHLGWDRGTAAGARWSGGRTHLDLAELRGAVAAGRVGADDVDAAIRLARPDLAGLAPVAVGGRWLDPVGLVRRDLLVGPEVVTVPPAPRCAGERWDAAHGAAVADAVDEVVCAWAARGAGHHGSGPRWATWRRDDLRRRGVRALADAEARRWLEGLPDAPGEALAAALAALEVGADERVDELRGQLSRLRGWAGYARWSDEWAAPTDPGPRLPLVELAAVRVALEAAALASARRAAGTAALPRPATAGRVDDQLGERVAAVAAELEAGDDPASLAAVAQVLSCVGADERAGLAQTALERAVAARLLAAVDGRVDGPALPPVLDGTRPARGADPAVGTPGAAVAGEVAAAAQVVCCIDVRSEPLRRHLERVGPYETLGFAGFFGVPVAVQELGWPGAEARCPVLVRPAHVVAEVARPEAEAAAGRRMARARTAGAADGALEAAHHGPASPFALAEAAGWLEGPLAAWRALGPGRRRRRSGDATTRFELDRRGDASAGLTLDERVASAAAVLTTMGLTTGFAPLVVLCGHGSSSRNNPHATGLDCGACGGASGADSARVAAALLDDPDVRRGLAERGIRVPDGTWFVPAVHDTGTDEVTLLDVVDVPERHRAALAELEHDLAAAGAAAAAERAVGLPGGAAALGRLDDPTQVRPEWGLAGAAAIVVGPRRLTAALDLGGRSFLHTYDADADVDGQVLETILTAPVVVAHWIASQYLFSSLDPEVFGAGDKLLHNPVGGVGVVTGPGGDLRVGLPVQSTAVGDHRVHEPLRLLVVVDAPAERVDAIVARHEVLQTLLDGSWVHLVARAPDAAWRWRTPGGGWADLDGIPDGSSPADGEGGAP